MRKKGREEWGFVGSSEGNEVWDGGYFVLVFFYLPPFPFFFFFFFLHV